MIFWSRKLLITNDGYDSEVDLLPLHRMALRPVGASPRLDPMFHKISLTLLALVPLGSKRDEFSMESNEMPAMYCGEGKSPHRKRPTLTEG